MKSRHFLTQVLLWGALFIFLALPAMAMAMTPAQQTQTVQTLEETLFAIRYEQDSMEARLNRLEETVFGQIQSGQKAEARIAKLKSALSPDSLGPLSPLKKTPEPVAKTASPSPLAKQSAPTRSTHSQPGFPQAFPTGPAGSVQSATRPGPQQAASFPTQQVQPGQTSPNNIPGSGESDYPTISQMEMKVFGRTFGTEDVTHRLERLEMQVFQTAQRGDLADRTDNLRLLVLGNIGIASTAQQQQPYPPQWNGGPQYSGMPTGPQQVGSPYPAPYPNPYPQTYHESAYTTAPNGIPGNPTAYPSPDTLAAVTEMEKEILGHTYPQEPLNVRLDRLEMKVFNATSPEMSEADRMQRVIAVASAGGAPESARAKAKSTFQTILPIILTILPMLLL